MVLQKRAYVGVVSMCIALHMLTRFAAAQTGSMPKPFDPVVEKPMAPNQPAPIPQPSNEQQSQINILQQQQQESVGAQSAGAADLNLGGSWPWKSNTMTGDIFGERRDRSGTGRA
jgi:hypothetical protein